MVAETLPIASFLFSKLGHDKRLDAGRRIIRYCE